MVMRKETKGQTIQWSWENTMVMRKETKGQTIQWSWEKWQKDRQYNGHEKRDKGTDNTMVMRKETKWHTWYAIQYTEN